MTYDTVFLAGKYAIGNLQSMDLWAQGLFVVAIGLVGVFLVLTLFFVIIVLMQKIYESIGKTSKKVKSEE